MLPSSSPASDALVVNRLVNISTAMIEPPKRYSRTIWKAPSTMKGSEQRIGTPGRPAATARAA